ncbi:uncharacterized protein LOC105797494 [Gossypium raimondii]|uniref:uncharacterized protein LOC105797494 n=1 Tax=Gossypium raimondii TaxID=29730 RepID=UPI00063A8E3D|nr:uncharacterized protein LOC105797494 [Gossypium raimondii]
MNGEMIENAIRSGKIDAGESNKSSASRKKENEVDNTSTYNKGYSKSITVNQPGKGVANLQGSSRFINIGIVKFDDSSTIENLLPNHAVNGINVMSEAMGRRIKADIAKVNTPLRRVWKEMIKRGLIVSDLEKICENTRNYCEFHHEEGHEIQECKEFKVLVQGMMDEKEVEFYEEVKEEGSICASKSTMKVLVVNHPVVIISRPKNNYAGVLVAPKITIQKPVTFLYKDSKKVSWNYECNVTIPGRETSASASKEDQGIGSHTCSGKHYDMISPEIEVIKGQAMIEQKKGEVVEPVNEPLHKHPARISMLALLLSSEVHRSALLKVLNEIYVANDISINKLDRLVSNISVDNFIFFNDDEIPLGSMGSTKACTLLPDAKGTAYLGLPVDSSRMKSCQNIVRAFDGTERRVMGIIEIPLLIGPTIYEVDFLVRDIRPSYNCLLGRPWIHSAGVVPSSLYQKLKLISEGQLVTINAEEDIIAVVTSDAPYLETNDEEVECYFRSLEFVNAIFITEGSRILVPKMSKATIMGLQLMVGGGALLGKGLGRNIHGRVEAPMLKDKYDHFGLGYKPNTRQRRKELEKRQERRRARMSGEEIKWEPMIFPRISKNFVLGGIIHPERKTLMGESIDGMLGNVHINAIHEERTEGGTLLDIRPYEPWSVLSNWTAEEIPVVFRAYFE